MSYKPKVTDHLKQNDRARPAKITDKIAKQAGENVQKLTRQLEQTGVSKKDTGAKAEIIEQLANGPISNQDWHKMEMTRFSEQTLNALQEQNLTADVVLNDADKAESFVCEVLKREGIPDGNGGTEQVKGVAPGHYDQAGHGIDVIAADQSGVPIPIEVKKYHQISAAKMENRSVIRLEPEVENWRRQREKAVLAQERGQMTVNTAEAWKPEVRERQKQIYRDAQKMKQNDGRLPVQQMDDLWVRDRWLKIIRRKEGRDRLKSVGIDEKYLNVETLQTSPDRPEWKDILNRCQVVIVTDGSGATGRKLLRQLVIERRAKGVFSIEVKR